MTAPEVVVLVVSGAIAAVLGLAALVLVASALVTWWTRR